MDTLFDKQDAMLSTTSMDIVRGFMDHVNWSAPMLCIRGPRGVGKSTLLRQYIKRNFEAGSEEVLYCSLDWVYFSNHSLLDVAGLFYKRGGKLLILDEVHKYENWSREVKEIAEIYPKLQLILSGSSLLRLLDGDVDLSRRCRGYDNRDFRSESIYNSTKAFMYRHFLWKRFYLTSRGCLRILIQYAIPCSISMII